jgi:hypothetical protein
MRKRILVVLLGGLVAGALTVARHRATRPEAGAGAPAASPAAPGAPAAHRLVGTRARALPPPRLITAGVPADDDLPPGASPPEPVTARHRRAAERAALSELDEALARTRAVAGAHLDDDTRRELESLRAELARNSAGP